MNKIVYNVTVSVDPEIHLEWITWMKDIHIPDVMKTGKFLNNRILRVHGEEENGVTYAVQYTASNRGELNSYFEEHAPRLQKEHVEKYGNSAVAFRTILEILHETGEELN
jgi:hypothetical protein